MSWFCVLQRIAEEFGGGWDADQLMHIWRRHAQRGAVARKGKWTQGEDNALLKVGWVPLRDLRCLCRIPHNCLANK